MTALQRWFRQTFLCDHMFERVAHHRYDHGVQTLVRLECGVCGKPLSPGVTFGKAA
jgi:hypothetical protein